MTDCNYCKQSPKAYSQGVALKHEYFQQPRETRQITIRLLNKARLPSVLPGRREGAQQPSSQGRARCLLPGARARGRRGCRCAPRGRSEGGTGCAWPGAHPHTPPAAPAPPAAGTNRLPPNNWDANTDRWSWTFQNLPPEHSKVVGKILWTRHTQASCRDLQRSVLVLDDWSRSSQETALISVKILEGFLWHANSEQKG